MIFIRRMAHYEGYILALISRCPGDEEPIPDWTWDARNLLTTLYHLEADLKKPALSKACLDSLAAFELYEQKAERFPPELEAYIREAGPVIRELYLSFTNRPEAFFDDSKAGQILSKSGRKAVREYRRRLLRIPPPEVPVPPAGSSPKQSSCKDI